MPEELKPCPLKIIGWHEEESTSVERTTVGNLYLVYCDVCGAESPAKSTEAEAILAWNTRPVSELERLAREVLESYWSDPDNRGGYPTPEMQDRITALAAYFAEPSQKGKRNENQR